MAILLQIKFSIGRILHSFKYNYYVYFRGERVPKSRDFGFDRTGKHSAEDSDSRKLPEVYSMKEVFCCGESGFIYSSSGYLEKASAPIHARCKIRRPVFTFAKQLKGQKLFHLAGQSSWNRAHFMFEHAARLMIGIRENKLQSCDGLLVHAHEAKWLKDYLKYFGLAEMNLVKTSKLTLKIDELEFVPGPSSELLRFEDEVYQELGLFLRNKVEDVLGEVVVKDAVVWLSRKDAPERSCSNIEQLRRCFEKSTGKRVKEMILSDLSLDEQIQQLREAKIIVAEEGQALNLLAFLEKKTLLIIDKGSKAEQSPWSRAFERMTRLTGGKAFCFFNELDYQELQWQYPLRKFEIELDLIADQLSV